MIEDFIYQILYGISVLLCTQYSVYFPSKYSQYMTNDQLCQWPSIITFDINLVWKYCVVEPTDAHNNVCFFWGAVLLSNEISNNGFDVFINSLDMHGRQKGPSSYFRCFLHQINK